MKTGEIQLRPGHQCSQASHEFYRTQDHMRSSIVVGRLKGDDDVAVINQGQTSRRFEFSPSHCQPDLFRYSAYRLNIPVKFLSALCPFLITKTRIPSAICGGTGTERYLAEP